MAPIYKKEKLLTVNEIAEYKIAILMKRNQLGILPQPLLEMFKRVDEVHDYNTRGREGYKLFKTYAKTTLRRKTLAYRGADMWNRLHEDEKQAKTLKQFKTLIRHRKLQW